jgi:YqaJ-like recombinase protein
MSLTTYDDLVQGSDDWLAQRRGLVTASVVGKLITLATPDATTVVCPKCHSAPFNPCFSLTHKTPTPIKAVHRERSDAASDLPPEITVASNDEPRGLTALLVAERITGWTDPTYTSDDMWRGIVCEPIARAAYSQHYARVTEVGFMRRDEDGWTLGYSPDGLVGDDGAIEIKAPRAKSHIHTILAGEVPAMYMPQCQAALLVSGRAWLDYVSFYGGLPLFVKRVLPDPKWFAAIKEACRRFEETAAQMVADYERRVAGLPATERVDTEIQTGELVI